MSLLLARHHKLELVQCPSKHHKATCPPWPCSFGLLLVSFVFCFCVAACQPDLIRRKCLSINRELILLSLLSGLLFIVHRIAPFDHVVHDAVVVILIVGLHIIAHYKLFWHVNGRRNERFQPYWVGHHRRAWHFDEQYCGAWGCWRSRAPVASCHGPTLSRGP
jgi:hypothetical protein